MVVAGRDQGGLSRAGEHRRALRPRGAQPEPGDEAAERGVAQDLREACDPTRLHPLQRVPARSVLLPILRHARGPDLRPSAAALARRTDAMGQRRHRVRTLQFEEGRLDAEGRRHVPCPRALSSDRIRAAPQRPAIPAELSARKLARLSLLGHRARSVMRAS